MLKMYSIIIPCYNEKDNLDNLLNNIHIFKENTNEEVEFILVDNGSNDETREMFLNMSGKFNYLNFVFIEKNIGYGHGIKEGIKYSKGDYLCILHADLQFPIKYINEFFDYIKAYSNKYKNLFLKGTRKKRPKSDVLFTFLMSLYESILFKKVFYDINGQPTIFSKSLVENYKNLPDDFSIDLKLFVDAKFNNFHIKRFKVIQETRKNGKSSWNVGFRSRVRLIKRTLKYSKKLKREYDEKTY
jgi:polyisoprenyl-phosphate glycosyltransferase